MSFASLKSIGFIFQDFLDDKGTILVGNKFIETHILSDDLYEPFFFLH